MKEEKQKKEGRKRRGPSFSTIILVLILLIGLGVLLYPTVSNWWNEMHSTRAIAGYVEAVEEISPEEKERIFAAAEEYNASRPLGANLGLEDEAYEKYAKILDITGTGIMGYVQIPSIDVNLPIYHGTEEAVLQIAIGHIAGTSFPIGGERTHSVLSGHRGLPSARLFTDLDKLVEGDIFTVTVLDRVVTYQIDQIRIVLPEETSDLTINEGEDHITLVTCTPYGVNTHRMLVRGSRIKNDAGEVAVFTEAVRIPNYIVIPAVGIPLLFVLLIIMLIYYRRKGPNKTRQELLDDIKRD